MTTALAPGQRIDKYVVEALIGEGGMASVYRVRHVVLETAAALKVLHPAYRERVDVRERFLAEGRIAARLAHANVVRVVDTVSTDEVAGLVMDLVEGPSLERYIAALSGPPPPATVRQLFLPVLAAIGEAHRLGVIHRDLKPANVLLEALPGGGVRPRVTDFGIAKVTDGAVLNMGRNRATHAEARLGTLGYMSPEQIRGAGEVTTRSDIFSLGATLHELATGKVAFDGPSDYELMTAIVAGRVADPAALDGIDATLAAAVRRALRPDPADRFATCEELAAALVGANAAVAPAPVLVGQLPASASRPTDPGKLRQGGVPRPSWVWLIDRDAGLGRELTGALAAKKLVLVQLDDVDAALLREEVPRTIVVCIDPEGFSVVRRLRRDPLVGQVPLIVTSAKMADADFAAHRQLDVRAYRYLRKPLLAAAVAECVFDSLRLPVR
jgi:eukaryotic-like serine/threonine-protein kinase